MAVRDLLSSAGYIDEAGLDSDGRLLIEGWAAGAQAGPLEAVKVACGKLDELPVVDLAKGLPSPDVAAEQPTLDEAGACRFRLRVPASADVCDAIRQAPVEVTPRFRAGFGETLMGPFSAAPERAGAGRVESVDFDGPDFLVVEGWAASAGGGPVESFRVVCGGHILTASEVVKGLPSPEVAAGHPVLDEAARCRFRLGIPLTPETRETARRFSVEVTPQFRHLPGRTLYGSATDLSHSGGAGPLSANAVLAALHTPPPLITRRGRLTWRCDPPAARADGAPLPLPPLGLRMGWEYADAQFLVGGARHSRGIRKIAARENVRLADGAAVMDWGCASGRILRHFADEARSGEYWGVDLNGPYIQWDKENLVPPFRFLMCTQYPHLPFEDNHFTLVYAWSVFTHVLHLTDMWLMEFRRLMKPGGLALFTVHDDSSIEFLTRPENREVRQSWIDQDFINADEDLAKGLPDDITFFRAGQAWNSVVSCYRTDWIRREWGQYFEVVSVEPCYAGYQSLVVLRKN
jgi:SAM-dependent methyltransferase